MMKKRPELGRAQSVVGQGPARDRGQGPACGQGRPVSGRAEAWALTSLCLGHWWDVSRRVLRCVRTVLPFSSA